MQLLHVFRLLSLMVTTRTRLCSQLPSTPSYQMENSKKALSSSSPSALAPSSIITRTFLPIILSPLLGSLASTFLPTTNIINFIIPLLILSFFSYRTITILDLELVHRKLSLVGSPVPLLLPTSFGIPIGSSTSQSSHPIEESDVHSSQASDTPIPIPTTVIPFKALNPNYKKWCIQGCVLAKTPIHEYTNQRGPGKLFGFELIDCSGEEIHVSTFNNFVDTFYSLVEIGRVCTISNGTIKTSNPSYNHLNNCPDIILSFLVNHPPLSR